MPHRQMTELGGSPVVIEHDIGNKLFPIGDSPF
jgi:hypothetical protein